MSERESPFHSLSRWCYRHRWMRLGYPIQVIGDRLATRGFWRRYDRIVGKRDA